MFTWRRTLLLILIWSVPAWLMVAETSVMARMARAPGPSLRLTIAILAEWYLWVLLTPVILRLSKRFPVNRFSVPLRVLGVHLCAMAVASALHGMAYSSAQWLFAGGRPVPAFWPSVYRIAIGWLPFGVVLYAAVIAAGAALDFARRLGERDAAAARLREQLARAQLDAIRARVHPHFLFNALHSVGALVRSGERDDAVRIVSDLSDLLREVLANDTPELVPLSAELRFVGRYLDIESIRFSDRLRVEWDIDESIVDTVIPPLLLQALVENAIRHGVARSGDAGLLKLRARAEDGIVEISITDDGPGPYLANGSRTGTGFGLNAARERLRALLGDDADVSVEPGAPVGTVARVRMPLRRHAGAATSAALSGA